MAHMAAMPQILTIRACVIFPGSLYPRRLRRTPLQTRALLAQMLTFELWGSMEESVEKSCWSITLWTVAIVVGVTLAASFIMGADPSVSLTTASTVTN